MYEKWDLDTRKLPKPHLVRLSTQLIRKTENELSNIKETIPEKLLPYHSEALKSFGDKQNLFKSERKTLSDFLHTLLHNQSNDKTEYELDRTLLKALKSGLKKFCLQALLIRTCDLCGEEVATCSVCNSVLILKKTATSAYHFTCPKDKTHLTIEDNSTINCSCGTECEVTFSTDTVIIPDLEFIEFSNRYLQEYIGRTLKGTFIIRGPLVTFLYVKQQGKIIALSDLRLWNQNAHIGYSSTGQKSIDHNMRILKNAREKCKKTNYSPSVQDCTECLKKELSDFDFKGEDLICLPRIFGLAINKKFDGIHTSSEKADIKYDDFLESTGHQVHVGIHVKSRAEVKLPKDQPVVGRGHRNIKGLYAQFFYSAYMSIKRINGYNFDILGIAIPNKIEENVKGSFIHLANIIGVNILFVEEEEWLRICEAAQNNSF